MSEYQYYEFQAIDRPLTGKEMSELRSYSTRARITPTSFVNDYSWGDFKGDPDAWIEKYFDAFLYLANWGTHILKLRLPARLLDAKTARLYFVGEHASVREKDSKVILTYQSDDEEGGEWVDGEGVLASLISARAELARGDRRALYLGWLLCAQNGDLDDDDIEPPIPAGLNQLSASLESLVEFFRLDTRLLHAAAAASPPLVDNEPRPADIREWVARLPVAKKDDFLARLIADNDSLLASELLRQVRRGGAAEQGTPSAATESRRVSELLQAAERAAAENAARENARREREAAIARARHLDALAGREPAVWKQVESLIATRQPKRYDQAVMLLVDLRDIAAPKGGNDFRRRVEELRTIHASKPTLIARLQKVGV
jgi:hypothetical protein